MNRSLQKLRDACLHYRPVLAKLVLSHLFGKDFALQDRPTGLALLDSSRLLILLDFSFFLLYFSSYYSGVPAPGTPCRLSFFVFFSKTDTK